MSNSLSQHAIAPAEVLRGPGAWLQGIPRLAALGQRPLVIGRSAVTAPLRQQLVADLHQAGLQPH